MNRLSIAQKEEFIRVCPRKVFGMQGTQVVVENASEWIWDNECQ